MACLISGGTIIWLYTDLPFSFSNFALYTFCNERKTCLKMWRIIRFLHLFWWKNARRPYPADELVDLLAVGGVTSLWQGGEGARLHVLLAGLFVFALGMAINVHSKIIFRVICVYLNCTKFPGVKIKWLTFLDDIYLWGQSAHSLGVQDLGSVLNRQVVALCLFVLLFVFHLEGGINPLICIKGPLLNSLKHAECQKEEMERLTMLAISLFFKARRVNLSSTTGITQPFIISLSYLYSTCGQNNEGKFKGA